MAAIEDDPEPGAVLTAEVVDEGIQFVVAYVAVAALTLGVVGYERLVESIFFIPIGIAGRLIGHL